MEVDEKPTEKYTDVGGLDKQIEELVEAVVWPMKEAERFKKIGIKAPKGKAQLCLHAPIGNQLLTCSRCLDVRPSRDRQDSTGSSMRCSNRRNLPQARWTSTRSNVHW
jgi:hypothetical protein